MNHAPAAPQKLQAGFSYGRLVRRRTYGSLIASVVVAYLVVSLGIIVFTSPDFEWDVIGSYIFNPVILSGVWATIWLTVATSGAAMIIGLVLAAMMESSNALLKAVATGWVWVFRGVPALVQLLIWYNLASLFPTVNIGIPPFGPVFFTADPNSFMTPILAALLGLTLSESAYMAEIIRGGFLSVGVGQREAAAALGVTNRKTLFRIVLPQAMRPIIPALGNQVIGMLKVTSLAAMIGAEELLSKAQAIYSVNFEIMPLLIVCSIWYLFLTTVLTLGQRRIEKRFGRGFGAETPRRSRQRSRTKESAPAAPTTVPALEEEVAR
ncbi:amino acid ABC transporter permease [Cnuibacter physcomitrellae]|uniref:amino acid ABC transporter permease n=1 Tax=Cnuibacter physcomitrellae TaxID=1619308 RepID=UPI002175A8AC|nr:amino acid ABC transporter permease [Cnuibacter physcomitrellae]MCS5498277.1 amino acid ABC transporter permease [Cnuibacter physcomitrellae]